MPLVGADSANFGKNASAITKSPVGIASARLVVPVASESPMLLDTVFCATPPDSAANIVPNPYCRIMPTA